jgi:hypothetical protein
LSAYEDLAIDPSTPQAPRVAAPLVFIGYGLHLPQFGHDDFAARDLQGKILVMVDAAPASLTPEQVAAGRTMISSVLQRAGAAGVIVLPVSAEAWTRSQTLAAFPGRYLADGPGAPRAHFAATFNPDRAEKLFGGSGIGADAILTLARAGRPLPRFDLGRAVDARISARAKVETATNLVGQITGSDPYLARNFVVVSAGAEGASALLDTARAAAAAPRPKRSIIFALLADDAVAASAFTQRPQGRLDSIVANLHIGAVAPTFIAHGGAESTLGRDALAVADALGVALSQADASADLSFAAAGVPTLELSRGPGIDLLVVALARRVADAAARPDWRRGSPFAPPPPKAQEALIAPLEMPLGKRRQRLLPVYGA